MRVAVLRFPGTNCELDTHHAFTQLGANVEIVWHNEQKLPEAIDLVVLAGGFSYGDYLRSGAIARFSPIMKAVVEYANEGNCVLGICNGFQILTEIGLLPGALKRNNNLHFISKFQTIKVINNDNRFLSQCNTQEILTIPIAHADGNYYIDSKGLKEIESNGQVLLRYCDSEGESLAINGSLNAIAGVCNKNKNVFGLMPHPERAIEDILGSMDGKKMLEGFMN
ncbi:MAG: phosphoribosylformylglycinamidine synthase [Sulfurovum sp. PC08-66]|jgi:phosphoribosylformylglycinamidine synthase|nr:MAG: phosphoribosylformylglycinamidine synthase [Sulfurovum sp. PC08-66]